MIIVSGKIYVCPGARQDFLSSSAEAVAQARDFAGCRDFVVAADPIEPDWARSPDLQSWECQGVLQLPAQRWMRRKHGAPFVWREGDGYVMMLMGTAATDWTTFGLLTSRDGVPWTLLPG